MRGKTSSYIASYSERPASAADYTPGQLMDRITGDFKLDDQLFKAVKAHLITREYSDGIWQSGQAPEVTDSMLHDTIFISWRAYRSDSDAGSQRYRLSAANSGAGQATYRDASWVTVRFTPFTNKLQRLSLTCREFFC